MIKIRKHVRFTICATLLLSGLGVAQDASQNGAAQQQPPQPAQAPLPTTAQENTPGSDIVSPPPRFNAGIRIEYFPERFFQTQYVTTSSTNPILSSAYFATSAGSKYTLGLSAEYMLTRNISVNLDFFRHQEEYTQLDHIKSGLPDPNSSFDNRPITSITQDTRADYWDFPLVARYYGLIHKAPHGLGWAKDAYVFGGGTYRYISNIRTGTSTSFPDSSTSYNETPIKPDHRNMIGVGGGVGYRLFEYGKFKSLLEARYTRWFQNTFQGPAYESQKNQLEIGLTFSY